MPEIQENTFKNLMKKIQRVRGKGEKEMHHYSSHSDAHYDDEHGYDTSDTKHLAKDAASFRKMGAKVSFSGEGDNFKKKSSTFDPKKHGVIHVSHHDQSAIEKHLVKLGHWGKVEKALKHHLGAKEHGGMSRSVAEYL